MKKPPHHPPKKGYSGMIYLVEILEIGRKWNRTKTWRDNGWEFSKTDIKPWFLEAPGTLRWINKKKITPKIDHSKTDDNENQWENLKSNHRKKNAYKEDNK